MFVCEINHKYIKNYITKAKQGNVKKIYKTSKAGQKQIFIMVSVKKQTFHDIAVENYMNYNKHFWGKSSN